MQYKVDLVNTKVPDNNKILIVEATSPEEAQQKAEKALNPNENYLLPPNAVTYRTTNVEEHAPVWQVSVVEDDGTQRVIGYQ